MADRNIDTSLELNERIQFYPDGNKEYWRDVVGYEGFFRVSNRGRVKSLPRDVPVQNYIRHINGQMLKLRGEESKHLCVTLHSNGVSRPRWVHRLVLEAFVGPCPKGMQCRHFPDRNPHNNNLSNLTWGTVKENREDQRQHGMILEGERNPMSKIRDADVPVIHRRYADGETCKQIAESLSVGAGRIWHVLVGRTFKHVQPLEKAKIRPGGFKQFGGTGGKLSRSDCILAKQLEEEGMPCSEIAYRLHVKKLVIQRFLNGKTYR